MLDRLRKLLQAHSSSPSTALDTVADRSNPAGGPETSAPGSAETDELPVHRRMPIPLEAIDPDAVKILRRLTRHGHTAYLVGGCVRDLLLGRSPKDFDISTSATPRQVKSLFRNCRIIGRRFQLAHIFFRGEDEGPEKIIEVSTFRAQQEGGEEGDLLIRRDNVFGTAAEDALRRDFTVNALFYDLDSEQVIDHAGGLPDLEARVLRTIGDPEIRLREDPIRILRAIKFSARLDLRIHPDTLAAMERHRADIPRCAPPRILEEFLRILRSGAAAPAFVILGESRVLELLLPEVDEALSRRPDLVETYGRIILEIDRRSRAGEAIAPGVLLAALLLPLMPWQANATADAGVHEAQEQLVGPVLERLRVPRRDAEVVRRVLLLVRKMVPGYRAKRFSRAALARRPYFPDLLQLFSIHCRATRHWADALRAWEELRRDLPGAETRDPRRGRRREPREPGSAGRPGRRRRRSGRPPRPSG